jgi:uncharacterized protein (DUF1697 family)
MITYIALLRGINVGGRNKLPMRELVDIFKSLGFQNIKTYIQSGNVVFQSEDLNIADITKRISAAIKKRHNFSPQTLILRLEEFKNAMAHNPYPEAETDPKSLHLYFLASEPHNPDTDTLEKLKGDRERYKLKGKIFYLHAPDGIGRSKLATRAEKALGVPVTARNWRSVCKIYDMANQVND